MFTALFNVQQAAEGVRDVQDPVWTLGLLDCVVLTPLWGRGCFLFLGSHPELVEGPEGHAGTGGPFLPHSSGSPCLQVHLESSLLPVPSWSLRLS